LLTGVFYSAYPRWPQTKRFSRPLRSLIARTLEDDPADRPQDPVLFTEELRPCAAIIERRQALRRRFGLPLAPDVARPKRKRRVRQARPTPLLAPIGQTPSPPTEVAPAASRWRPAWAIAGGVFVLGLLAALFLPEDVVTAALHRKKPIQSIGVPVGVPDRSFATVEQKNIGAANSLQPRSNQTAAPPANAPTTNQSAPPGTEVAKTSPVPPPAEAQTA